MAFTATSAVLLLVLGFGVGAFGTLVGAGGGFILTPILLLVYPHDSPKTLTAISLMVVFFNAASGTAAYARQRRTDFRSGLVFAVATIPGAIGGALLVADASRAVFEPIMGAVLAVLAAWLIFGEQRAPHAHPSRHLVVRELVDARGERYRYEVPLARGALYSLAVGFF